LKLSKIATTENNLLSYQSAEKRSLIIDPATSIELRLLTVSEPLELFTLFFPDVKEHGLVVSYYNSLLVNDRPQTKHDLSLRFVD
jgi:hypothetical protein